jgi:hypothetical protein
MMLFCLIGEKTSRDRGTSAEIANVVADFCAHIEEDSLSFVHPPIRGDSNHSTREGGS